jgi:phytoene desaturase
VLFADGSEFDYVGDEERLLAQIRGFNARDVDGYRRLAAHARRIFEVGYERLADVTFDRARDMLGVIPSMVRLESYRTVWSLVSRYIRDERLRRVFTFEPLLVGGSPFRVSSIYLLIHWLERRWGVHFALGGTGSIVRGLVRLLDESGVRLSLGEPVERIETTNGRVTGVRTARRFVPADVVVSNADPSFVYTRMIDPLELTPGRVRAAQRVRQSMSLFVGYFGTERTYPALAHHTIVLGRRYEGLLDDIFRRRHLADDFSLYLHAPTRTDTMLAPAGRETFYVLSPVPNTRSGVDWSARGEEYFDCILGALEDRLLPGLRGAITTRFSMTPHDFERDLRSVDGAAFGPEPVLTQSAYFRYHNRAPELAGLYFVGAGTHPGAGVPGVLCSAKVLDRLIPRVGAGQARGGGVVSLDRIA